MNFELNLYLCVGLEADIVGSVGLAVYGYILLPFIDYNDKGFHYIYYNKRMCFGTHSIKIQWFVWASITSLYWFTLNMLMVSTRYETPNTLPIETNRDHYSVHLTNTIPIITKCLEFM